MTPPEPATRPTDTPADRAFAAAALAEDGMPIGAGGRERALPSEAELAAFEAAMAETNARFLAAALAEDGMPVGAGWREPVAEPAPAAVPAPRAEWLPGAVVAAAALAVVLIAVVGLKAPPAVAVGLLLVWAATAVMLLRGSAVLESITARPVFVQSVVVYILALAGLMSAVLALLRPTPPGAG